MADVKVTFTIPSVFVVRAIKAITETYGYQEEITDVDGNSTTNPENKAAFSKRLWREWLINVVKSYEAMRAAEDKRKETIDNFDFNIL